jgi:hypothetical protein
MITGIDSDHKFRYLKGIVSAEFFSSENRRNLSG